MSNLTYIDKNGYKRYRDSKKLVHRHVAKMKLHRKLRPEERVHHKNRNKLDNRRSNLWICKNQKEHENYHRKDKKRTGRW